MNIPPQPASRSAYAALGSSLLLISLGLLGCSADSFGVQSVVLGPDQSQAGADCVLLSDDGSSSAGETLTPPDAGGYREEQTAGSGKMSFRYYVRAREGSASANPLGELALEIKLNNGNFGRGSARSGVFQTADGVSHRVYVWGTNDCEDVGDGPPQWVRERLHEPSGAVTASR
jgi:hypothetical protein